MNYLTAKQLSIKWEISERRIIKLCQESRIEGATKNGMVWLIPEDTKKPEDKRYKVAKYINTKKRVIVVNADNQIGMELIPKLLKSGYIVDSTYISKEVPFCNDKWKLDFNNKTEIENLITSSSKYYDGIVFLNLEDKKYKYKDLFLKSMARKMDCEGSILLVNNKKINDDEITKDIINTLGVSVGLRINTLVLDYPAGENVLINSESISDDIVSLLAGFKNSTGMKIFTSGDYLKFDKNGISEKLDVGKFYRAIDYYYNKLQKGNYLWSSSTMMQDEWTEEPLEMLFRVLNLEATNRGVKVDRQFLFSKSKIKEYRENKTLQIYANSNINTYFVDLDEVLEKEPELLKGVGAGWEGIDDNILICDLPEDEEKRGYVSINKQDVKKAYNCFKKLMKYAKSLKEVLK